LTGVNRSADESTLLISFDRLLSIVETEELRMASIPELGIYSITSSARGHLDAGPA
jgi:hypothetical protein